MDLETILLARERLRTRASVVVPVPDEFTHVTALETHEQPTRFLQNTLRQDLVKMLREALVRTNRPFVLTKLGIIKRDSDGANGGGALPHAKRARRFEDEQGGEGAAAEETDKNETTFYDIPTSVENNWFGDAENEPVIHPLTLLVRQANYPTNPTDTDINNGGATILKPFRRGAKRHRPLLECVPRAWEESYLRPAKRGERACSREKACLGLTELPKIWDWPRGVKGFALPAFRTPNEVSGAGPAARRDEGLCLVCLRHLVTTQWAEAMRKDVPIESVIQPYRVDTETPGEYDEGAVIPIATGARMYGISDNFVFSALNRYRYDPVGKKLEQRNCAGFDDAPYVLFRPVVDSHPLNYFERERFGWTRRLDFELRASRRAVSERAGPPQDDDEEVRKNTKKSRRRAHFDRLVARMAELQTRNLVHNVSDAEFIRAALDVDAFLATALVREDAEIRRARTPRERARATHRVEVLTHRLLHAARPDPGNAADAGYRLRAVPDAGAFGLHALFDIGSEMMTCGLMECTASVCARLRRIKASDEVSIGELVLRALPFEGVPTKFALRVRSESAVNSPHIRRFCFDAVRASLGGFYPDAAVPSLRRRAELAEHAFWRRDPELFARHPNVLLFSIREAICFFVEREPVLAEQIRATHGAAWDTFANHTRAQMREARHQWNNYAGPEPGFWCAALDKRFETKRAVFREVPGWEWDVAAKTLADALLQLKCLPAKTPRHLLRTFDVRHAYDGVDAVVRHAQADGGYDARACEWLANAVKRRPRTSEVVAEFARRPKEDRVSVLHEAYLVAMFVSEGFRVRVVRAPHHWYIDVPHLSDVVLGCTKCRTLKGIEKKSQFRYDPEINRSFCHNKRAVSAEKAALAQAFAAAPDALGDLAGDLDGGLFDADADADADSEPPFNLDDFDPADFEPAPPPALPPQPSSDSEEDDDEDDEEEEEEDDESSTGSVPVKKRRFEETVSPLTSMCEGAKCAKTECVPMDMNGNIVEFCGRLASLCKRCGRPSILNSDLAHGRPAVWSRLCDNCISGGRAGPMIECEACGARQRKNAKRAWMRMKVFDHPRGDSDVWFCHAERVPWVVRYPGWSHPALRREMKRAREEEAEAILSVSVAPISQITQNVPKKRGRKPKPRDPNAPPKKPRRPRDPNKPRVPRAPREKKPKEPKEPKEPKPPKGPPKKRGRKPKNAATVAIVASVAESA